MTSSEITIPTDSQTLSKYFIPFPWTLVPIVSPSQKYLINSVQRGVNTKLSENWINPRKSGTCWTICNGEKKSKILSQILPLLPSDWCLGLGLAEDWLRGLSLQSSGCGAVLVNQGGSGGILSTTEALPLWSGEDDLNGTRYCTFLDQI